jgi:hypothetical protein
MVLEQERGLSAQKLTLGKWLCDRGRVIDSSPRLLSVQAVAVQEA